MEATASFGSHSGPIVAAPAKPRADITDLLLRKTHGIHFINLTSENGRRHNANDIHNHVHVTPLGPFNILPNLALQQVCTWLVLVQSAWTLVRSLSTSKSKPLRKNYVRDRA
eukprot:5747692-Amphidinium_carterae.2